MVLRSCILSCILFFFTYLSSVAQSVDWAFGTGGDDYDYANALTQDNDGNILVTGSFSSIDVDFDPGPNETILSTLGAPEIFFAKYDTNGNLIWAKSMGGTGIDFANGIITDSENNIFLIGCFDSDIVDLDPGVTNANFTSNGSRDFFFAKYDTDGNYLWAQTIGGSGWDKVSAIDIDDDDNIYITGSFEETMVDFDPGPNEYLMSAWSGVEDVFFAKYASSSAFVWAKRIGKDGYDEANDIRLDAAGNIYLTGRFEGTDVDFDPRSGFIYSMSSNGYTDVFLAKYNSDIELQFAFSIGGTDYDYSSRIYCDDPDYVILAGRFDGTDVDFDPDEINTAYLSSWGDWDDPFMASYDVDGNFNWAKLITGSEWEYITAVETDNDDNIYVFGSFLGSNVDFDPGPDLYYLSSNGGFDLFYAKYSPSGDFTWAHKVGSSLQELSNGMLLDGETMYSCGSFSGTDTDFDMGTGNYFLDSNGFEDMFLAKHDITALGIEEFNSDLDFNIYGSERNIKIISNENSDYTYSITNILGQTVSYGNIEPNEFVSVNIQHSGLYIVLLNDGETKISKKIIVN